jgi:hypothetical protein
MEKLKEKKTTKAAKGMVKNEQRIAQLNKITPNEDCNPGPSTINSSNKGQGPAGENL